MPRVPEEVGAHDLDVTPAAVLVAHLHHVGQGHALTGDVLGQLEGEIITRWSGCTRSRPFIPSTSSGVQPSSRNELGVTHLMTAVASTTATTS